ncbi:MAG: acyl-CoA thioesterase [Sphingopyxis sp.]
MSAAFTQEKLIRFQHCDPAGLLFYPKAFELVGEVIEDWFHEMAGMSVQHFHQALHRSLPTVETGCVFFAPVRVSDHLIFTLRVEHVGHSSLKLSVTASHNGKDRYRVTSQLVHVRMDPGGDYRADPFPAEMRQALRRYVGSATEEEVGDD